MASFYSELLNVINASVDKSFTPDITEGVVVEDNPISVEIDKNSPLLDVDFLIIPEHLHEHDVEVDFQGDMTFNGESSSGSISGTFTVKSDLKVGDAVILLRVMNGQRYLVLDRL